MVIKGGVNLGLRKLQFLMHFRHERDNKEIYADTLEGWLKVISRIVKIAQLMFRGYIKVQISLRRETRTFFLHAQSATQMLPQPWSPDTWLLLEMVADIAFNHVVQEYRMLELGGHEDFQHFKGRPGRSKYNKVRIHVGRP